MPATEEFLNPKSMLTPGIAGGLAMTISLGLSVPFGLSIKWVALIVSFLLGLAIVLSIRSAMPAHHRGLYWILNSLIVFSTCIGGAVNIDLKPKPPAPPSQELRGALPTNFAAPAGDVLAVIGIPIAAADEITRKPDATTATAITRGDKSPSLGKSDVALQNVRQQRDHEQKIQEYQEAVKQYEKRWSW